MLYQTEKEARVSCMHRRLLARSDLCGEPVSVRRRPRHVTIVIWRAVRPPDGAAFAQRDLRGVDRFSRHP